MSAAATPDERAQNHGQLPAPPGSSHLLLQRRQRPPLHFVPPSLQLFNQMNARKILDSSGAWEGLSNAPIFQLILGSELALQIAIVQVCAVHLCLCVFGALILLALAL